MTATETPSSTATNSGDAFPVPTVDAGPPERFRPSAGGWIGRGIVAAFAAFVIFGSVFAVPEFRANEFTGAIVFAIAGLSLNVLIGYTGTLSLGHQAFVGIGAFTSAYVVTVQGQSFWLGVAVAAAIGGLQAFLLGLVALRVSGLYFALITLSYGILAQDSFFNIEAFTGGAAGQPAPSPVGENFRAYYFIALGFLAVVLYLDYRLMTSKGGRALLALRENPKVAQTFSIDVKRYTLAAFVIAGFYAGIGGAVLAHSDGFVVSNPFSFQYALLLVIVTVVGGLKSRAGIIVSAIIFSQLKFFIEIVPGLDSALANWGTTFPVILILIFAITALASYVRLEPDLDGKKDPADLNKVALGITGALALIGVAELIIDLPGLSDTLEGIPVLTPEIARVVLAPTLLLVVLTTLPGGLGQLIRPVQHWVKGNKFDFSVGVQEEVTVSDVRA